MFERIIINNFIVGNSLFIPDKDSKFMWRNLLKGDIHYNFLTGEYKTIESPESFEAKINRLCILFVNGNKYAVGLEYIYQKSEAPVLILKTSRVKWITKICKRKGIDVIYNKEIAAYIYSHTEEYSIIPSSIWEPVATIFADILICKDKKE
jgi:type III secretory pathway component EscU